MKFRTRRLLQRSAIAAAVAGISGPASAAFFAIAEQSASGVGSAFAGGAAIAEDASTVWYNPAGMTRLSSPQLVVVGSYLDINIKTNSASATTVFGEPIGGGAGKDPGVSAFVPAFYYTHPLTKDFSIGAGINSPFGLKTEYDDSWAGRYHAIKSDIKTINYNLGAGYKINEVWSLGAGVSYQTLKAEFTQAIDFGTICNIAVLQGTAAAAACGTGVVGGPFNHTTNLNDGSTKITADSNAWGYNLGALAQLPNDFRVGVAYRSKMSQHLKGDFNPTVPATAGGVTAVVAANAGIGNTKAKADIILPSSFSVSAYQQIGQWALMADITRTNWGELRELRIQVDPLSTGAAAPDSVITLNLKNSYRYSVGGSYKLNDAWTLRGGFALDQTPVTSSENTTPRLPDADRYWYAIGAGWQLSRSWAFDFGYVMIKADDAHIRKTAPALPQQNENTTRGNLSADYSGSSIQVFSAQARWTF